jgi:hypothetical protein
VSGSGYWPFVSLLSTAYRLQLVHPDFRDKVEETLRTSLEKQQPGQVDFAFKNGNWVQGHVRWWARGLVGVRHRDSLVIWYSYRPRQ